MARQAFYSPCVI